MICKVLNCGYLQYKTKFLSLVVRYCCNSLSLFCGLGTNGSHQWLMHLTLWNSIAKCLATRTTFLEMPMVQVPVLSQVSSTGVVFGNVILCFFDLQLSAV